MTLIAFACKGDHAEIITDTGSYPPNISVIRQTTKVVVLSHIDTALMTQGDSLFGAAVKADALASFDDDPATNFDELVAHLPARLALIWDGLKEADNPDSTVFAVGHSDRTGQFQSYLFASEDGFTAVRVEGVFAHPSPPASRPHDLELARMRAAYPEDQEALDIFDKLGRLPARPVPSTLTDWAELALDSRLRSRGSHCRVMVFGSLHYLHLERGGHTASKIFDFPDDGEEFAAMVDGTDHPVALRGPCGCESGKRLIDCHAEPFLDEPCRCGRSGQPTFRECCAAAVLAEPTPEAPAEPVTA